MTISGDVTDLAGNSLDGDGDGAGGDDYVYGAASPQNEMLMPLLGDGDFNYDGWVEAYDYITVKQHMGVSLSR